MNPEDARSTQERLRQSAHEMVDRAIDAAGPAADWFDARRSGVTERQRMAAEYASSNPVKALAVAVVVGLILGRILL